MFTNKAFVHLPAKSLKDRKKEDGLSRNFTLKFASLLPRFISLNRTLWVYGVFTGTDGTFRYHGLTVGTKAVTGVDGGTVGAGIGRKYLWLRP